ncbi:inositol monophosphatase family protein [Leucothrix pacifica]|nr:inositol monophosphatase family protein [Leucothrix pacifica]
MPTKKGTTSMLPDMKIIETIIRDVAQQEILPRFNKIGYELKHDGSLITEADLAADERIHSLLSQHYPGIAFMSEEMTEQQQIDLLTNESEVWCLDPLDGTSNFAAGVPLFASSLSLIKDGEVVMGITYDVNRDEMFTAIKGEGAYLNGERLNCTSSVDELELCVALVDFKRLPADITLRIIQDTPYRSQRNLGSTVLEWVWMAASRGQLYLHGGMKLWDCAAGSLILEESGGMASTLEGNPVFSASVSKRSTVASPSKALYEKWFNYIHER